MLRRCCWPTAVPIEPGDVPMMAEGFPEKEFSPQGRLAQSMAFFSPPGMERLYSGVTKSTASTLARAALNARPGGQEIDQGLGALLARRQLQGERVPHRVLGPFDPSHRGRRLAP